MSQNFVTSLCLDLLPLSSTYLKFDLFFAETKLTFMILSLFMMPCYGFKTHMLSGYRIEQRLIGFVNKLTVVIPSASTAATNSHYDDCYITTIKGFEVFLWINRQRRGNELNKLQATIHSNNQDIHSLFEQIKMEKILQENAAILMRNRKKRQQDQPEITVTHNAPAIRQKIEAIRVEVSKAEEAIKHYEGELQKIQEEWKSFLKHFLKQGFYFQDGVTPILKEMVAMGYTPTTDDFPIFLDSTSKQCLLAEHAHLREQLENAPKREVSMSEHITESRKNMRLLVKKDNLLRIYDGTKDYMMSWVRNQGWKQESGFPRIQSTQSAQSATQKTVDWRAEQKKRLNFIDDKQRKRKVRAVLFGSKVETIT